MKDFLNKISISDLIHSLTILGAVIAVLVAVGSWKRGVEDHLDNQDVHVKAQDESLRELTKQLTKENEKLQDMKESMQSLTTRLKNVEDFARMVYANRNN